MTATDRPLRTSESIGAVAAALAKAQAAFRPVHKDRTAEIQTKTGGRYSYAYVDLATIHDAIRGALTQNELAITQALTVHDHRVTVETTLLHASGEWLASALTLQVIEAQDPRSVGSAITYGRRFGLTALVGIAAGDDDDAEAARPAKGRRNRERDDDHEPPPIVASPPSSPPRREKPEHRPITEAQQRKLFATAKPKWPDIIAFKTALYDAFGIDSTKDLRMGDFEEALAISERGPRTVPQEPIP